MIPEYRTPDSETGDLGLELGIVGAALAHRVRGPFQSWCPAIEVTDVACPEKRDQLAEFD